MSATSVEIEPAPLHRVREWVLAHVKGVRKAQDRRGFQLLQWETPFPNVTGKSYELSLEHEARLVPRDERAAADLLDALFRNEGRPAKEFLLRNLEKDAEGFGELVVRRYDREPGPQSVDHYYEATRDGAASALIPRMITVRERMHTRKFMTWSASASTLRPLNLELPFVSIGASGMTVRLEFNWIGDIQEGWANAVDSTATKALRNWNPLFIAMQTQDISLPNLKPVIEHTTFRQKFGLWREQNEASAGSEVFAVNLDTVVVQNLFTKRIGTYVDIDVSSVEPVDTSVLQELISLSELLAKCFDLQPNPGTKAWRDAVVTRNHP